MRLLTNNNLYAPLSHICMDNVKDASDEEQLHVTKIKHLLHINNQKGYQVNKPHRNCIITGMPGSGLNLFLNLLNKLENVVCFNNEISDIEALPQLYVDIRKSLLENDNSKTIDEDVIVALYQNLIYFRLNEMQGLKRDELKTIINNYGYNIIAIIGDPIHTISEWSNLKNIPESMVMDEDLSPRWDGIKFISKDKIERQAQIWQFYADLFWNLRFIIKIYTFEQIKLAINNVIKDVCNFLDLQVPDIPVSIDNYGSQLKYQNSDKIQHAVHKFCPIRVNFGYDNQKGSVPGIWDNNAIIFCRTVPKIA